MNIKNWTVKLEMLVQHVAFADVEAASAEEAIALALSSSDLDFEEDCNACEPYAFSVSDEEDVSVDFCEARVEGHEVFQRVYTRGLEELPRGVVDGLHANLSGE